MSAGLYAEAERLFATILDGEPTISDADAVECFLALLPRHAQGEALEELCRVEGAKRLFRSAHGKPRRKASVALKTATLLFDEDGQLSALTLMLQQRLPHIDLPYDAATLVELEEAIARLMRQAEGLTAEIAKLRKLARQLSQAVERTGDATMTLGQALRAGLLSAAELTG